jgi:hypothetical protein
MCGLVVSLSDAPMFVCVCVCVCVCVFVCVLVHMHMYTPAAPATLLQIETLVEGGVGRGGQRRKRVLDLTHYSPKPLTGGCA